MKNSTGGFLNLNESFNTVFGSELINLNENLTDLNPKEEKKYIAFLDSLESNGFEVNWFNYFGDAKLKKEWKVVVDAFENYEFEVSSAEEHQSDNQLQDSQDESLQKAYDDFEYIIIEDCKKWIKMLKEDGVDIPQQIAILLQALQDSDAKPKEMKKWYWEGEVDLNESMHNLNESVFNEKGKHKLVGKIFTILENVKGESFDTAKSQIFYEGKFQIDRYSPVIDVFFAVEVDDENERDHDDTWMFKADELIGASEND